MPHTTLSCEVWGMLTQSRSPHWRGESVGKDRDQQLNVIFCGTDENIFRMTYGSVLEKAVAPQSSTLAWKIPWTEEPGRLQSMGSLRVGHDWATSLSCIGEGNGNPLQCSCLENPRDGGALVGCRLWGRTESDTTWSNLAAAAAAAAEEWDGGDRREAQEGGIYVHIQLIHAVVQQKLTQLYKATILQFSK